MAKGKTNNPEGRPKGVGNKTTEFNKDFWNKILSRESEYVLSALKKLRQSKGGSYWYLKILLEINDRLFARPKQEFDLTSGGHPFQVVVQKTFQSRPTNLNPETADDSSNK